MPSIHILGGPTAGRKTFSYASKVTGYSVDFTPERGMITIRSPDRQGREKYERVNLANFLERIDALRRMVKHDLKQANIDSGRARRYRQEATILQRIVDCMWQAYQEAERQGDPMRAFATMATGASRIRRPTFETPIAPMPIAPVGRAPSTCVAESIDAYRQGSLYLPPSYRR